MGSLAALFGERFRGTAAGDGDALEGRLASLLAQARAAWPGIELAPELFVAYLASRLPVGEPRDEALAKVQADDLYLACACALGEPEAIAAFERTVLSEVPRFIARIDRGDDFVDHVRQLLREKLLVAGGEGVPARIEEYSGRGALGAWVRVAAIRTALNEKRSAQRSAKREERSALDEGSTEDPELDVLKARYASEVREALETSLRALSLDQRNVLRMHYLDGLSIDAIGPAYGVHRATAARWIADARSMILTETKRLLLERLRATPSEVASVLMLVKSRIDISIRRFIENDRGG